MLSRDILVTNHIYSLNSRIEFRQVTFLPCDNFHFSPHKKKSQKSSEFVYLLCVVIS